MKISIHLHFVIAVASPLAAESRLLRSQSNVEKPLWHISLPPVPEPPPQAAPQVFSGILHGSRNAPAPAIAQTLGVAPVQPQAVQLAAPTAVQAAPGQTLAQPGKCTPKCTWRCGTRQCDEVCTPSCAAPRCQTRCNGMSTLGCKLKCDDPKCRVLCPPTPCAASSCPGCAMQCDKPSCTTVCPSSTNTCNQMCEKPVCNWKCTAPLDCPKPTCNLECDPPRPCNQAAATTVQKLPPLENGQMVVESFQPPMSLLHKLSANNRKAKEQLLTVQVTVTRAMLEPESGDVKLVHSNISMPVTATD